MGFEQLTVAVPGGEIFATRRGSGPAAIFLQTELGRAVPEDGGPATLTQAAPPPTATVAGAAVRWTVCALFVLGSMRMAQCISVKGSYNLPLASCEYQILSSIAEEFTQGSFIE